MPQRRASSPRLARALVEWFTPASQRDVLVGDMEETFHRLRNCAGAREARRWYWRQSLGCVVQMPREHWVARPLRSFGRGLVAAGTDLRFASRSLRDDPGFALPAVAIFAVGVAANAVVFSFVDAVLLRPLPYPDSDRLVMVWDRVVVLGRENVQMPISHDHFERWRSQTDTFAGVAAFNSANVVVRTPAGMRRIPAHYIAAGWTRVLGVAPRLGRGFLPADDVLGAPPVVIVSHRYWEETLGADPDIIGTDLEIVGVPTTIVGVMPAEFWFYDPYMFVRSSGAREDAPPQLWLPLDQRDWAFMAEYPALRLIARLSDRTSFAAAAEAATTLRRSLPNYEGQDAATAELVTLPESVRAPVRNQLRMLAGAVLAVLTLVCFNLTSLTVTRTDSRRNELAVRAALGAGRLRIARLVVGENLVIGFVAGTVGTLVAAASLNAIVGMAPRALPLAEHIHIDARALVFSFAVAMLGSVAGSFLPILRLSRGDLPAHLTRGSSASGLQGNGRVRAALVVAEVGLTVTLLVAATLMLRTVADLRAADPGFDPEAVLTFQSVLWREADEPINTEFYPELLRTVRDIPGVVAAGGTSHLPFTEWGGPRAEIVVNDEPPDPARPGDRAQRHWVTPGFFDAAGIRVQRGRDVALGDDETVALVNQSFIDEYLDGAAAIGSSVGLVRRGEEVSVSYLEIVGVVANVRHNQVDEPAAPRLYALAPQTMPFMQFALRTKAPTVAVAAAVRDAARRLDPNQPVEKFANWSFLIDQSLSGERFYSSLLAGFGAAALLIAAIGVYGTVSYSVRARLPEFGIRKALGARDSKVCALVLVTGLAPVLCGALVGLGGAAATTRTLGALLHDTAPLDPISFGAALGLFGIVSVLAVLPPARRAARLDPVKVLRAH